METKNSVPTEGLAILTNYNPYNHSGWIQIVELESGKIILAEEYWNFKSNDNALGLVAVSKACLHCESNNYSNKIYCSNAVSYKWAIEKRFNTKTSSPNVLKLLEVYIWLLEERDFSNVISFWQPHWGNLREHVSYMQALHTAISAVERFLKPE